MIRGYSIFLFLNDSKIEYENMINFLCLLFKMMLRTRSFARASAVKIEVSIGRPFLSIVLFKTAAHAVLLLSLEPYRWSGWCWRI